jgi:hypothetical protein
MVKRGFKAGAARLALEVRDELGIGAHNPLDVNSLAELYGVPIVDLGALGAFGCTNEALDYYQTGGTGRFSAAAVPMGRGVVVIVNDTHVPARQKSSVAHELAHLLLEHEFPVSLCTDAGCRAFDGEAEEQADLLGGELLIPTEAAKRLAVRQWTDHQVAELHGVSARFAKMRMDTSGARLLASRAAARRAVPGSTR